MRCFFADIGCCLNGAAGGIGRYRTGDEATEIVSGRIVDTRVYFEAPPSRRVPKEMARFVEWFNRTASELPALTRAGIAHLYFELIHPFADGNGRIGRAVAQKALAQAVGQPKFTRLGDDSLAAQGVLRGARRGDQE